MCSPVQIIIMKIIKIGRWLRKNHFALAYTFNQPDPGLCRKKGLKQKWSFAIATTMSVAILWVWGHPLKNKLCGMTVWTRKKSAPTPTSYNSVYFHVTCFCCPTKIQNNPLWHLLTANKLNWIPKMYLIFFIVSLKNKEKLAYLSMSEKKNYIYIYKIYFLWPFTPARSPRTTRNLGRCV